MYLISVVIKLVSENLFPFFIISTANNDQQQANFRQRRETFLFTCWICSMRNNNT